MDCLMALPLTVAKVSAAYALGAMDKMASAIRVGVNFMKNPYAMGLM
jgi:hypothetical protein